MLTAKNQKGMVNRSSGLSTKQANQAKQVTQNPLTLRDWIYATDGKNIKELVKTSFLEFYFMRKTPNLSES